MHTAPERNPHVDPCYSERGGAVEETMPHARLVGIVLVMPQTGNHCAADAVCMEVADLVPQCL